MKFLPSHKVHALFQTANSPRGIADTAKQLVLAGALVLAPATVTAQVTDATRAKIVEIQASDPAFKLKTVHRGCLDGSIVDSSCEEAVRNHVNLYKKEKEVNAREVQLANFDEIIFNLDISLAMLQLVNYIEFNEPIPKDKDTVAMIINSDKTPAEVRAFLKNTMAKKQAGITMKYNPEGKELLGYVKTYTDAAMSLMGKITIRNKTYENLEKQITVTRQNYMTIVDIFSRKSA